MIRAVILSILCVGSFCQQAVAARPNILWITSEDNGAHLGCYGDSFADTPNLDALAAKGTFYLNAWSTLPVCAPARTAIITGMYPSSIGAEHMRSLVQLPGEIRLFPEYLREAGYYCTNNRKEDYNVPKVRQVWDESSGKAHWKNRKDGQPFFAVFNITTTHESQIRRRPHIAIHDPASVPLPAHYPDAPESRTDWAQYYDKMTVMDKQVGKRLRELEDAGLLEDTIIMYYGDHGIGLPRSKRSPYNSGLRVPLIVHVPEKYRHLAPRDIGVGTSSDRLVSFVDLAPTVLLLAGLETPKYMQGKPFLGAKKLREKEYLFGTRGRMDERYDMIRVVRDKQYLYMKNYMPYRPHGQHVEYMFKTPSTRAWYSKFVEGSLSPEQAYFWRRKTSEELYDLAADPDEIHNLAGSSEHRDTLMRMRAELERKMMRTRDVGFVPEPDYYSIYKDQILFDLAQDKNAYPLRKIQKTAGMATGRRFDSGILPLLEHSHPVIRYWAATGVLNHHRSIPGKPFKELRVLLDDVSPSVRIVAAEALAKMGTAADVEKSLATLLDLADLTKHHQTVSIFALNALDNLDELAAPILPQILQLPTKSDTLPKRNYARAGAIIVKIEADFK